jgi:hypothetical protein
MVANTYQRVFDEELNSAKIDFVRLALLSDYAFATFWALVVEHNPHPSRWMLGSNDKQFSSSLILHDFANGWTSTSTLSTKLILQPIY